MRALVTGATGFIGGVLARRLHSMGWQVIAQGRNGPAINQLKSDGIRTLQASLEVARAIDGCFAGQDIVFHCAALTSDWGHYADFYASNVIATRNVAECCRAHNVKRLVHVSTPSIYFSYEPRLNVKETDPLPARSINDYARTKRMAEEEVERASAQGLPTITIRPSGVFGPGDRHILPRLIDRLQRGVLPIIGDGTSMADLTYVENVVEALLLCATAPDAAIGRKYNITNGEPISIWQLVSMICERLKLRPPKISVPYAIVDDAARLMETAWRLLPLRGEPALTRYSVARIGMSSSLDIQAARQDLGYEPSIPLEAAVERTLAAWEATHPNMHGGQPG